MPGEYKWNTTFLQLVGIRVPNKKIQGNLAILSIWPILGHISVCLCPITWDSSNVCAPKILTWCVATGVPLHFEQRHHEIHRKTYKPFNLSTSNPTRTRLHQRYRTASRPGSIPKPRAGSSSGEPVVFRSPGMRSLIVPDAERIRPDGRHQARRHHRLRPAHHGPADIGHHPHPPNFDITTFATGSHSN